MSTTLANIVDELELGLVDEHDDLTIAELVDELANAARLH